MKQQQFIYFRRKERVNRMIQMKMDLAKQRKESLQNEKQLEKMENIVDNFKKHWAFREKTLMKNIELLKLSEKMRAKSMKVILLSLII